MTWFENQKMARNFVQRCMAFLLVPLIWLGSLRGFCMVAKANEDLDASFERVRAGFYSFSSSIDLTDLYVTAEELSRLFTYLIKDDPYLFYVDGRLSYSYSADGYVIKLKPNYIITKTEAEHIWRELDAWIKEMSNEVCGDDAEKALRLHDLVLHRFSYDESLESDNIYKLFLTGTGTCQAYTMLYLALLRESEIPAHFVASDSIEHIWNLVEIDGKWYHVDLTWDDGNEISRRHFLCSDQMALERGHKDWYSPVNVICDSEQYRDADFDAMLWRQPQIGDLDHSGDVGMTDLLLLRACFEDEQRVCYRCADADRSEQVNQADVEALRRKILLGD